MRDNLEHTIQSPLCQNRRMYTHKKMHKEKKRRKHTNILPVTVSEWTGWQMIFIFFLRILLDFLNCYNDFPNQTTNKTKTKAKLYLFQQANGNVGVQGPLVGFIQHDGTRIRGTISVNIKPTTAQAHPDHQRDCWVFRPSKGLLGI